MYMGRPKPTLVMFFVIVVSMMFMPGLVFAGLYTSPHYEINQNQLTIGGNGGLVNASSTHYEAMQALGETAVGTSSSTNYIAQGGFSTSYPYLTFIVNGGSFNLGTLSSVVTSTATETFSVRTYLAQGYVVQNASTGPLNGSYTMVSPSSPTVSSPGTEQFGINLVANNSCTGLTSNIGANPVQVPSGAYSNGAAASGYNTACQFKYVDGDAIASSSTSSGETDYTISYIFNISSLTPGGTFVENHVLVATSTY
jgi:hypothetical protein